jgi:hypothetical protein
MGMQDVVDALLGRPGAKVQKRGSILPMVKTDEGMGLGWPEMALDAWRAVSLPKAALEGYQATPEDIGNFALTVGAGGLGASTFAKPKGGGKILGMFANEGIDPLKSSMEKPLTVYRGGDTPGSWHTTSKDVAAAYAADRGSKTVTEKTVNFSNPLVVDADGANWINIGASPRHEVFGADGKFLGYAKSGDDIAKQHGSGARLGAVSGTFDDGKSTDDIVREAKAAGHDGVIIRNVADNANGGVDRGLSDTVVELTDRPFDAPPSGIRAYHGSPHNFDRFSMDKIGTGEGAQAYGHGLYFAENEGVAKSYRDTLAAQHDSADTPIANAYDLMRRSAGSEDTETLVKQVLRDTVSDGPSGTHPKQIEAHRLLEETLAAIEDGSYKSYKPPNGHMYEVNIAASPDDFLDWDKPLSEQSEKVRGKLGSLPPIKSMLGGMRGKSYGDPDVQPYFKGSDLVRDPHESAAIRDAGIPGVRYLDQGSRTAGDGSRNYVVFDDKLVSILKKYGVLGGLGIPAMGGIYGAGERQ